MKIIIGICSAAKNVERRAAVRDTWLQNLPSEMRAFFFVGAGHVVDNDGVIQLDALDDYDCLPMKVQAFFHYICEHHDFDYAFKCDDDTYVNCVKLLEFVKSVKVAFVGSSKLTHLWTQGGAGYLMNREAITCLSSAKMPETGPEDYYISRIIKESGISFDASDLLQAYCKEWPVSNTQYITAHHCSPKMLRYIHAWIVRPEEFAVISSYYAYHTDWKDILTLRKNGTFCLGNQNHASGTWEFGTPGNQLYLHWFYWPVNVLTSTANGYVSKRLRLIQKDPLNNRGERDPIILTRVCLDDFDIFKIWTEYYRRRYNDIQCCIFKRKDEDVSEVIHFCDQQRIGYAVLHNEIFDNEPTYAILRTLTAGSDGRICLIVDCDEFVSNFDALDQTLIDMQSDSVVLKMVDRVSYDIFYDLTECRSYEDLCAVAPLSADITSSVQKWANTKCCINRLPDLGNLHYPSQDKSSHLEQNVYLDHFKWRKEWLPKARRRLEEIKMLGLPWKRGLVAALNVLDGDRPKRYLSIPGRFGYENLYEEQCRILPEGAVLVELGVWKGRSIAFLSECAKKMGKHFKIFGVDLFEQCPSNKSLLEKCTLAEATRNLKDRNLLEDVTLIKTSATNAAASFENKSVDFVWLDAGHSMREVKTDFTAWWPKIKTGGTIGGYNLPYFDTAEALNALGIEYVQNGASWIMRDIPENRPSIGISLP